MPLGYNRILGDPNKSPENRPHRVALANWPASIDDPRTATIDALVGHLVSSGYEGIEFSPEKLAQYYLGDSLSVMARKARYRLERAGLQFFGQTLHCKDAEVRELGWRQRVVDEMKLIQQIGGEYASVQFFLHPEYLNTGGLYRKDEQYLKWCADRVTELREMAWSLDLNFYLEVHIDRITEDPAACCRILEMATCELNGDMSHLLYRAYTRGRYVETILNHLGHTHVRMARQHGDLSAAVDDPKADWQQQGVTWQMFQLMMPGLASGLSSRAIVGETGPMHLVRDTLTLDASLVPLYRAMARYADAGAQGIDAMVQSPEALKPWG